MTQTILHIDSSARTNGSVTREMTARIAQKLGGTVQRRDLSTALPQISEGWLSANFTDADTRTDAQREVLAQSDALIEEIQNADTIVIGVPIYNFGVPAALKAWIDLVARAGVTFRYTENGPEGLLSGKRAILAVASGGTPVGSDVDFATDYLRHFLAFIGITDVQVVSASQVMLRGDEALSDGKSQIDALAA